MNKRQLLTFLTLSAGALGGCNSLALFNDLTPKDKASRQIAKNVKYGNEKRQDFDVYAPDEYDRDLPIIVFFYGGSWDSGEKNLYSWAGRALAALGYVVFVPNYRIYPDVTYPSFVEDCANAVKYIIKNADTYKADANKIALIGHSAGAYNAAMLMVNDTLLGEDFGRIKAFVGVSGPYDFYPYDVAATINSFGTTKDGPATQPINLVKKSNIKTLLLHSTTDTVVNIRNSRILQKKLLEVGNDAQLIETIGPTHQEMVASLSIPFRKKAPTLANIETFLKTVF